MDYSNSTGYHNYSGPTAPPPPPIGVPVTNMSGYEGPPMAHHTNPWSSGLCGCFSDVENCCMTALCPCVTFGRVASILDQGNTPGVLSGGFYAVLFVLGFPCCYGAIYRAKLRKQYLLEEAPCGDCLLHLFCDTCALCQEYRELQYRGFDMKLGWKGNVEKHTSGVAMAPRVEGGMTK